MSLISPNDDDYYSDPTSVQAMDDWMTVPPSEYDDDNYDDDDYDDDDAEGYDDNLEETAGYEEASSGSWWDWYNFNSANLPSSNTNDYGDDDDEAVFATESPDLSVDDDCFLDDDYHDDDQDKVDYKKNDDNDDENFTASPVVWSPQLEQLDTTFAIPSSGSSSSSSNPIYDNPHVPIIAGLSLLTIALVALVRGQQHRGQAKSSYGIRRAPPVQRDLGV